VHIQRARVDGVVGLPRLAEERFAFHHFAGVLHENFKQNGQPRRKPRLPVANGDALLCHIQRNGTSHQVIVVLPGQQVADAVDELLHGKGQHQDDIGVVVVVGVAVAVNHQDERQPGLFLAQRLNDSFSVGAHG